MSAGSSVYHRNTRSYPKLETSWNSRQPTSRTCYFFRFLVSIVNYAILFVHTVTNLIMIIVFRVLVVFRNHRNIPIRWEAISSSINLKKLIWHRILKSNVLELIFCILKLQPSVKFVSWYIQYHHSVDLLLIG